MTKYKPLYALYKGLKEHGTDLPDSYGSFERSMTQAGNAGASNRRNFYQSLKDSNCDVPDTYEKFYESMFVPVNNTTSRARKIGETPITDEDRKGFTLGAQDIRMNASKFAAGDALRYNKLKQRKQKQRKDFGRVKVGTNKTPYAPTDNVVKDEGLNTYVTSDSSDTTNLDYAQQKQAVLDEQNQAYMNAIERGDIPMASETIDKNGLYDLQENIGKDGTEVTEKGIKEQAEARLNVAYQKQKDIMAQLSAAMDGGFSTFEERMQLSATKNKIDEEVRNLEALAGKESSGFWNTLADVANTIPLLHNIKEGINYLFGDDTSKDMYKAIANSMVQSNWDFGVSDIQNSVKLEQIRDKINKGEAVTKEEKEFLDANQKADKSAEWVDQYGSRAYRWTSGAGVSVPYMIDFYITGDLPLMRGMTQAFGRGAMKIAAKRGWGKLAHNIMYYTGVAAGDIIGSYAMATTVQGLKTGSDVLNRHLGTLYQDEKGNYAFGTFDENGNLLHEGGESFGKALYKGVTAAMLENYTEKMFGHWHLKSGAFDLLDKNPYTKKLADFFRGVGNKNWYLDTKKFSSKFGIGSYPEEVAEEIVNIPLNAWLVGDNSIKELGDRKTWEDIAGSMAISVGSMAGMASTPHIVRGAANQGIKAYDFAAFYVFKNRLNQANQRASEILGDEWEVIKNRIDSAPNENLGKISADLHKQVSEGKYSEEQLDAAWAYIQNLRVMRGYNLAKTMEMQAKAMTGDENTPADIRQKQLNAAYAAGQETEGENKHLAQVEYEKQKFNLASALGVSDSELENMTDEQISSNLGLDDNLDNVIYNYQNAKALYDGIMDNAQNAVDTATKVAAQRVDAMTNVEDGTIKQALVKGTMGKDDYPVYVISGNIETHDDGIINYSDSDSMVIVYNVATGRKETIPVSMLSAVNPYIQNAEEFKAQAVNEAKEKTITELSNVIDGKLVDGSQFTMEDAQGQIHEYKIEGIDEQGNCIISVDGTILPEPLSLDAIQQQYDQSNVARSVKNDQTAQEPEQIQQESQPIEDKFDYAKITNENDGKVKRVDVTDEEGKNRFPNAKAVFLIQDKGAMPKFVVMDEEGNLTSYVGKRGDKIHLKGEMTIDEYKKQRQEELQMIAAENADSSMIEDNSGTIWVEDNEEGKLLNRNDDGAQTEQNQPSASVTTSQEDAAGSSESKDTNISANGNENNESLTFEDGTPIPVDVNGEVDLSQTDATHAAEWYDNNLGEDADDWLDGEIKKAKKVLEQAKNKKLAGTKPSELVASKKEKEAAIADAQAHYDSAISIRDSLKERRIAKEENTSEGRRNLIEKARRKFARLKSAVKNDAEAVAQIYKETVGTLLHRLYDGTGIDVTDTIPLTAEEYVASNLGAHSLNYEGTETSKGVKQETGLSREDFAKTQLLAADGKGTTIDNLVHSLWENRPSNLDSLDTQDIRNALLSIITSGFKASEARNYIENLRIAQAENILEEQKKAADNAAFAEEQKAKQEEEDKKAEENAEEKAEEKTHSESFNKIVDLAKNLEEILDNPDNVKEIDKITHEIDELLENLSDKEFKEVSDVLLNIDEDLEYLTADEYERREGVEESKKAKAYNESLQQAIKRISPYADALKAAVKSDDKKAIAKARKELTDALLASNLGHGYLSGQLEYAKSAKKKDESYSERRALVKPLTDAIDAIESALDSALAEAGLKGVHVDFTEGGHGWIYADKGSAWSSILKALDNDYRNVSQYETQNPISVLPQVTIDNVEKVAGIIKSRIEEGERYNSDEYNDEDEQTKFPDKLKEGSETIEVPEDATDEKPLGEQRDSAPFSPKDNTKVTNSSEERKAMVKKNAVRSEDVLDHSIGKKMRKSLSRIAKMMGADIIYLHSADSNGWYDEKTNTIYLALDSADVLGTQFVFGHEMTHEIKAKNPAAFEELKKLVKNMMGEDAFNTITDKTQQKYEKGGATYWKDRNAMEEEVVADQIGNWIHDANYAHTLMMKMSHPLLAKLHEIVNRIRFAFTGTEYSDNAKLILRSIEQAYVKTANGQVTNSETGEDVSFSLRQKPEPKKKGIGYKVFVLKDGKLYPPMVANPDGAATPVGVWLDADAAPIAGESKTGRPQVKQGGKGTQGGSGKLAYRPGWHLGVVPYAIQFNRKDAEGNKTLFPKNFVFAEVEYAADVDYQEEARQEGINPSGKYQHSLAGLKHLPTDGYYMYRTNPNPETDPWVITGAMKVNRILTRAEQAELVKNAGREPQQIQEGDIVTDDVVNSINQEIADAPKFSLKVYHGSGADFTEFDFDHMGEGAGSQVFGWGGYVTSSKKIGKSYATLMDNDPSKAYYRIQRSNGTRFAKKYPTLESFLHGDKQIAKNDKFTEQEKIDYYNEMKKLAEPYHNLYEVDIPEDNGSNYLDWDKPLSKKQQDSIREGLEHLGVGIKTLESKGQSLERTGENIYNSTLYIGLTGTEYDLPERTKGISKFLSFVGFTGIKYKAGRNFGGAKKGDTNYVIFKPEDMKITQHTKFSLKSKPVRFETGKKLSDEEKKEVLSTLKDAYKVNGVPYHIEETAGGKEKRVYEPTADSYVVSDITNRPLRYYITLPDGRVAHPTEVYPNISDNEVKSSATKQGLLDDEADQIVSAAIGNMKGIADNAKVLEVLTEMQNLPHETHDFGYGMNNAQSYNYKTGIFTSDAAQAIDYVVRRMRRKEDVPAEIPAALKKAVDDSYGMVDNLIDGMSNTKVGAAEIKPVGVGAFGNIYNQFRGKAKAAIEFLKKVRGGEAVGALYHKDIGDIDLVWGKEGTGHSDGYGLSKLVKYHPEVLDNLQEILNDMRVVSSSKNRVNLESETHKAGVRLTWDGERKSWLLTAFKKETSASDKRTDTAATSLEGGTALSQTEGSAAKIDNSSETAKENGEKFSLKNEKTMFGMHNISVDKLRKAIKQGGFAAPSMGVVDSKNGIYSDYGEITLIPKAEKLAKRTGKNAGTFTADAWTPTYPQVERIMNKQGEKAFNTDMNVKLGDVDNGIYSNVRESWKGYLSSGDVRDGLYWHYLFDNGMNPETIYQTGKYDNDITNEVMRISDNGNKTDYTDKEVAELIQLMNKATGKDNDVDAQREKLKARIASAEKQGNHLLIALKKKRLEELEGVENFYVAADFVNDVVRNNRKNGKVDVHDTMGTAKKKVEDNKKLSDDFPSWLDKKTEEYGVEEMLYNGTTPSGKPKYIPNTIENAVKLMKKQGVAGGYTAFGSELGVFIAKNSPEVNTLAAMKNAKDKLIPFGDERHNQIKDKITKEFLELSDEIRVGSNNRYAFDDSGVSRMVELTDHKGNEKEYLKKAYNIEVSDEWMDRYNKLLDTIKKDYKVFYFETKFMRPYGLDEFEKAIVPSDTPSDVIDALKKAGIDVSSYERGNAEDRQKVTMDAINSSDNIRFSLAGERGSTPYGKQMEEWMEKNHLEKGAVPMEKPIMKEGENIFDYANRMVEWTRNQNLWKTAPKQTGFQDALDKWKADNGLSPDAYPPVRPHRENYSTEIGYAEDLEEYNKKKELWKSAPKPKNFDLSVDLEDMNKQLRNIRRAVLNQKNYDQRTVKAVSDLVRKMLNIGWGDGLSRGKVGNLLSAAKNATGANDVKKYLDKAMGILADNYLNRLSTAYDNLINTKGARADQSGVIKMGSLDANGQAFMSEYKKAINMDDSSLNTYIANIEEDSAKNEDNVEMNDYRLAGIQAAIMYKQQIGGNDADIAELKRQIGELKNKKDATKEDKDLLKSLEKKLFENKFDRITMYENLLNNIQRMVKESKGRAKEFREEITEHKNEILHRANLDLEGVDSTYYDTTTAKKKLVNNALQRAVLSSTYTFEQFLKFFGKKAANGEGYLYNYFTKLNQDALDEEQLYNEMNRNALDEKTKELFGKEKFMKLVGIDGKGMKEMDVEVTDYSNKETGKRTIHLKQGQMLYIYLVNKETDGEMKLRAMGITEEDVAAIEENLDPRVKAMGEWLQDEYLPECQRRYQATHTKYFGAPMKEVENYFPLAINNRARNVKEDVNQDSDAMSQLAGTSTGAIVTRRVNVIPLDIENADAFEVAFNHLQEMEEWSAMLPFRQDINTLLSYTHFRNQVQNMSSVAYGSGKTLWDEFKQTAQIAAGTYKPKVNAGMMDSRIAAAMGGIAVAKISGRLWTAIKQSQSATVFLPECDFTRFVKNGVNPYGSWKWAMENIPDFRKRVENMTYGDVKLRQYLDELEKWHDWTKTISKIGMAPNILVDGITCAVGARSVYETEVNRLTKLGYPKEKAEEKAYYKAVAAYNKTQQSSGGMYLSPMQVDRTYVSAALSLFKNANYAYGRMQIEAFRGLARTYDLWGGKHKTTLIESMTRQIMEEDGLDENTARAIAKATYNRTFRQSIGRLINFATLVPVSWALYKVLPYLLTGDDDDKKKDMIEEAVLKGFATSLSDNYVIPFVSNILNAGLKVEDGKPTFDPEMFRYQNLYINPATSDLANIYSMIGNQKWYSVANKLGMLGVQSLIGFNPETVGALYQAVSEADYDNGNTAKEWQIGILKAISAPEESIRELYMDELGLKSGDIKKIPLAELEKRYAERQINRDNLLSQIVMDAETFNGYVDKYQKSFEKKIKDKMDKWDEYDKKKADEFFDTTSDPKLKDMIEKKRTKDANAAADEQIAKEGLNQEKKGKEPSEETYDAVKMSIDVAEDNAISTYNKVLNKRYAALNDEYNNQTDAMKYIFMSKHPNFKSYKDLESEYTTYGKKMKELKEKLVSADGYDAKQTILKQIRAEREKFSELQSKVR